MTLTLCSRDYIIKTLKVSLVCTHISWKNTLCQGTLMPWPWVQVRPMPWDCSGYRWKRSFRGWGWKRKAWKLSQSSATLGTCSLQEVVASWLQSHAANVHGVSSANCFPFSPTAICPFWPEIRCTHHVRGVWCCMQQRLRPWRWIHWTVSGVMTVPWSVGSAMSVQRTKLAQTPFSQSLASRT